MTLGTNKAESISLIDSFPLFYTLKCCDLFTNYQNKTCPLT